MSGIGTTVAAVAAIVAAGAAVVAARFTKQAVAEAAKAAKSASDQVELQRPNPIVVASFSYSFSDLRRETDAHDEEFQLQNIGESAAFDVEVSMIEAPGVVPGHDARADCLRRGCPTFCLGPPNNLHPQA
jgi:hypothetical protein